MKNLGWGVSLIVAGLITIMAGLLTTTLIGGLPSTILQNEITLPILGIVLIIIGLAYPRTKAPKTIGTIAIILGVILAIYYVLFYPELGLGNANMVLSIIAGIFMYKGASESKLSTALGIIGFLIFALTLFTFLFFQGGLYR